jgi:hypothetical protein
VVQGLAHGRIAAPSWPLWPPFPPRL